MSLHADIVYPWIDGNAHALNDLRYSLRSLEEMWKGTFKVTIVGAKPTSLTGFWHIPMDRLTDPHAPKALDAVRKMQAILDCGQIRQRFVYMYDDICFLRPMDMDLIEQRIGMYEITPEWRIGDRAKRHHLLLLNTVNALRDKGLKRVWNYETHSPRVFDKRKMAEVIDIYRPAGNRLLLPTLYFNHHWPNQPPMLMSEMPDVMARFAGRANTRFDIAPAPTADNEKAVPYYIEKMNGCRYLNWNNGGMRVGLQYARHSLFPDPSSFEYTEPKRP
jgi:hypothetical protein